MIKLVFSFGVFVFMFACAAVSVVPQAKVAARKEVKVYFYHDPGEYIDLAPVNRSVNAAAPARPAIEALLKGPTAAERRRGFESLASASDFRIGSLKITGGTARINFVSTRRWTGWPGDLAPVRFKSAVELTLKQFSTVQRVIVSLNGDEKFYDERGNHVNSESAEQDLFGTWHIVFRTSLKSIGIKGNYVDVVNVECGGRDGTVPGATLIKVQDRQMLTIWHGVFFVLKKQRKN